MEIYVDVLVFVNFISTYIILDITQRLTKRKIPLKRKCLAAFLGALLSALSFILSSIGGIIRVIELIFVPYIAFYQRREYAIKQIIMFLAASLLMTALFTLFEGTGNAIYVRNGIAYFNIPILRFCIIFFAVYAVITAAIYIVNHIKDSRIKEIKITLNNKSVTVKGLIDSGNMLREPISKKPVIVAEWSKVCELFNSPDFETVKTKLPRLRIVPYRTVSQTTALMYAFMPDKIQIADGETSECYIGISEKKLSDKNEYNALIGTSIL